MNNLKAILVCATLAGTFLAGTANAGVTNWITGAGEYLRNAVALDSTQVVFSHVNNAGQGLTEGYNTVVNVLSQHSQSEASVCANTAKNIDQTLKNAQSIYTAAYSSNPNNVKYVKGAAEVCEAEYAAFVFTAKSQLQHIDALNNPVAAGQTCTDLNQKAAQLSATTNVAYCTGQSQIA